MTARDVPSELFPDGRQVAAAAGRNRQPILDVLKVALPKHGTVLEIASGSGEHVTFFANALPDLCWQPSDPAPDKRVSISAWKAQQGCNNVNEPLSIDTRQRVWTIERLSVRPPVVAILAINLLHISPWAATLGLLDGAERILRPWGKLFIYGPFMRGGVHTAPSNAAFDERLQAENPEWGLRDVDEVVAEASSRALELDQIVEMPANNLSLVFTRG